jgi:hypothetical protein
MRNVSIILVSVPEGNRTPMRPRHRWKDFIEIYRKEIGCEVVDQRRIVHVSRVSRANTLKNEK